MHATCRYAFCAHQGSDLQHVTHLIERVTCPRHAQFW